MHASEIYCLTPQGEQQLRGGQTTASPAEIELLVRIDGVLTVGEIRAGLPPDAAAQFEGTLRRLVAAGLLRRRTEDPFADQFEFKPSKTALQLATSEADAAAASLRKAGYFVRIARRSGRPAARPATAARALVVEDDPHLAGFLQHYLGFEGFDVAVARARAEVVAELRKLPVPALVLLDVMLPDADGFDILAKMRQHPALKEVPVIMLTAKATRESVIRGLATGADGYVTKPFEADALLDAVRTVMGLPGGPSAPGAPDPWPEKAR